MFPLFYRPDGEERYYEIETKEPPIEGDVNVCVK